MKIVSLVKAEKEKSSSKEEKIYLSAKYVSNFHTLVYSSRNFVDFLQLECYFPLREALVL